MDTMCILGAFGVSAKHAFKTFFDFKACMQFRQVELSDISHPRYGGIIFCHKTYFVAVFYIYVDSRYALKVEPKKMREIQLSITLVYFSWSYIKFLQNVLMKFSPRKGNFLCFVIHRAMENGLKFELNCSLFLQHTLNCNLFRIQYT